MSRILMALVGLIGLAFAGAVVAFVSGEIAVGVLLLLVALFASIAIPIVVAIVLARRARAAVTAFGAAAPGSVGLYGPQGATTTTTTDRRASSWLPAQSANSFTTTTTTTSGDLDPATAEAMVRSLTGMGLDELVRRATSGELIPGADVDVDVVRRAYVFGGGMPDEPSVVDVASTPLPPPVVPFDQPVVPLVPAAPVEPTPEPTGDAGGEQFRSATATVHGIRDTGVEGSAGRIVELDLLVSLSGTAPYRAVVEHELAPADVPRRGQTVWVRVDPQRPGDVELS